MVNRGQVLNLNVITKSIPRSFAEFETSFSTCLMDFSQKPQRSLIPNHRQYLSDPILNTAREGMTDSGNQMGDVLPGLNVSRVDILFGVAVDYNTEAEELRQICSQLNTFQKRNDTKTVVVVLIIDGLEVLTRNEGLKQYFLEDHFRAWGKLGETQGAPNAEERRQLHVLETFRRESTYLNFEEKQQSRGGVAEADSGLVFYTDETDGGASCFSVLVLIKPRRRGKLHSDLWLFAGFAQYFQTEYVSLLDPEITPEPEAVEKIYQRLEDEPENLLGVFAAPEVDTRLDARTTSGRPLPCQCWIPVRCLMNGFAIVVMKMLRWSDWFEVLYSQMMYTPMENLGGYISYPAVRFVMFRWPMLKRKENVLMQYFKPLINGQSLSWLDSNLYEFVPGLLMCLQARLFTDTLTTFAFESSAIGKWRMPNKMTRWIDYRSRVLNANFLGFLKAIAHTQSFRAKLSCQNFGVLCEFYFFAIAFLFKWLAVGILYVLSSMAVRRLFPWKEDDGENKSSSKNGQGKSSEEDVQSEISQPGLWGFYIGWKYVYLVVLVITFFMALGKLGDRAKYFWLLLIFFNVAQSLFNYFILFLNIIESNSKDGDKIYVTYVAMAVMIVVAISFPIGTCLYMSWSLRRWFRFIANGCVYLLLLPVYTNVITIFSICNTTDDCWGLAVTCDEQQRNGIRSVYSVRKNIFLIVFIITNIVFGVAWEQLDISSADNYRPIFLIFYFIGILVIVLPVSLLQVLIKLIVCCKRRRSANRDGASSHIVNKATYSNIPNYT